MNRTASPERRSNVLPHGAGADSVRAVPSAQHSKNGSSAILVDREVAVPIARVKGTASHLDFDLHGIVALRLIDPTPGDAAAVRRQLGPIEGRLAREPDIRLRFVPQLELPLSLRLLGLGENGFGDDGFYILRGKDHTPIRVKLPLERLGGPVEIVCQSGLSAVPLLIAAINLTALARGALPLHASAFRWNGQGILVTGWAKGGKTEALLAFAAEGAEYVADEWTYLDGSGGMYGIPEPIRLWDWHLSDLPQFRAKLSRRDRLRLWSLRHGANLLERLSSNRLTRRLMPRRALPRLVPFVRRQLYVQVPPRTLFEERIVSSATVDKLIFIGSHDSPRVTVRPIDPQEVARRMVYSLQAEQSVLRSYYEMFRFAFPQRRNAWIEQSETLQRERLTRWLSGKTACEVLHPYPAPVAELYRAIVPWLGQKHEIRSTKSETNPKHE